MVRFPDVVEEPRVRIQNGSLHRPSPVPSTATTNNWGSCEVTVNNGHDAKWTDLSLQNGTQGHKEGRAHGGSVSASRWLLNSSTVTRSNGRCTIVVNDRTPSPDSDALDFGERGSGSTEVGKDDINECYNVKLNAPQEVIVAGFHDFCQTMLSIEDPPLDQGDDSQGMANSTKSDPLRFRRQQRDDVPVYSPRRLNVDAVRTRSVVYSSKVVVGKVYNTEYVGKKESAEVEDAEVMAAIRELDNSLVEAGPAADEDVPEYPPPPAMYSEQTQSRHDREVQNDNLIEEVMLQDTNQRISDAVKVSNCLATTRITVHGDVTVPRPPDLTDLRTVTTCSGPSVASLTASRNTEDAPAPGDRLSGDSRIVYGSSKSSDDSTSISAPSPDLEVDHRQQNCTPDVAACHRTSPCSIDSGNSSHHQNFFVVVAIDFGTTYSGYAFSFTRDPENVHMMKKWDGGDPGVINQKTPTTLLLTPEGSFHSFGYSARDYYHDLDSEEAKSWLYFEKFKMALHHNEHLSLDTEIKASNGKSMPAVKIFAMALQYFKEQALQEITDQSVTRILNEDVRWVVTVPAIWKQPAKQFMRAAAYEAGMASPDFPDQLLIALEPEAASIYCRRMRMHQLLPETPQSKSSLTWTKDQSENAPNTFNNKDFSSSPLISKGTLENCFSPGTRYMVVDCGGGTVDITAHEILDNQGTLKELQKASGGPYGSVGVDMDFERLLCDIFGADFMQQFKTKRPTGYVDLMVAFEARKRNANPYKNTPLNISLPFSFIDYYKKCKGSTVETALKKYGSKEVKWSSQGMLRLEPVAMQRLFKRTVDQIRQHIANILDNSKLGIDMLFLVGGFSESLILQKEIRDAFSSHMKVVIPQGVSLAILKGAVLFGLDPTIVNIRRLRMTYGAGVLNRFIHGVHPPEKLVVKDGVQWCADVFDKFVVTDQSVGRGDVVVRSYTPAKATQRCSVIHIYCSESDDVHFITDPGVQRCATLILDISERYIHCREIQTRMMFGDTEIKVTALDVATGKCVKADVDFLGH